jgi:hypothetical protein
LKKNLHYGLESGIFDKGGNVGFTDPDLDGLLNDVGNVEFYTVRNPVEYDADREGDPKGIYAGYAKLNDIQSELLASMPDDGSWLVVKEGGVNMEDLAAMTASKGVEFAIFEKGQTQLIVRGNKKNINVNAARMKKMANIGYEWKGHTHVGVNLVPSSDDLKILMLFTQEESLIYNAKGEYISVKNPRYAGRKRS